jgi:hypothetical protein
VGSSALWMEVIARQESSRGVQLVSPMADNTLANRATIGWPAFRYNNRDTVWARAGTWLTVFQGLTHLGYCDRGMPQSICVRRRQAYMAMCRDGIEHLPQCCGLACRAGTNGGIVLHHHVGLPLARTQQVTVWVAQGVHTC